MYKYLTKHIENDFLKDFTDSSVDNIVKIELIFKKGVNPTLRKLKKQWEQKVLLFLTIL